MGRTAGIILFLVTFIWSTPGSGQKYWELGGMAGASYYLGDVNPSRQFYSARPTGGGFVRLTLTQRWQTRFSLVGGYLQGNDRDFTNQYQWLRNHSFATPIVEAAGTIEFNFRPFKIEDKRKFFSPFVYTGAAFFMATNASHPYQPAIPFGVGFKLHFLKLFTFGVEWGFRKSFTDGIDRLTWYKNIPYDRLTAESRLPKQTGYVRQRDWYSFALVSLSFKLYSYDRVCHIYQN